MFGGSLVSLVVYLVKSVRQHSLELAFELNALLLPPRCRLQKSAVSQDFNVSLPLQSEGVAMVCAAVRTCACVVVDIDFCSMPVS